jgi:hypothetical protein
MTVDPNAKRERARRLATDYSASQRERDQQDRVRGHQKRGAISEGAEKMSAGSLDRTKERVDRPPLSETTEVETKLHSANKSVGKPRPERVRSERVKNAPSRISKPQDDPWR